MTTNLPVLVEDTDTDESFGGKDKLLAVISPFNLPAAEVEQIRGAMVEYEIGHRAVETYLKHEVTVPQMLEILDVRDRLVSDGVAPGETLAPPSHICMVRFVTTFGLLDGADADELTEIVSNIRNEMMKGNTRFLQMVLDHLVEQSKHYPGVEPLVLAKLLTEGVDVEDIEDEDIEDEG